MIDYKSKLVCPRCGNGFIVRKKETEDLLKEDKVYIIPTMYYPFCNNCSTLFEIEIYEDLSIRIKEVNRYKL